jgi:hypothetical protein
VSNWTRGLIEQVQLRFILRRGLDNFRSASSTASVVETESDLVLGNRQPDPIHEKRQHRGQKFLNNELRSVVDIVDGKIIFDKGEIVLNGAALHLDQGIAVTSHASEAKTVDQVIASVPVQAFGLANEAQFYVSMSRARWAMHVFTDSKVALREAVTRPSKRLSSWELFDLAEQDRTLKAELARQRSKPKKQQQEIAYER